MDLSGLLSLFNLYNKLKTAVIAKDWATVVDAVADLAKALVALTKKDTVTLTTAEHQELLLAIDSGLSDEDRAKLDPATLALILQLISMGVDWLVKIIKRRRGIA